MKKKYSIKRGSRISVNADVAGKLLEEIESVHGMVTPELIVKASKRKSSPLYSFFDWDNNLAADKWRLTQAKYLIRSITVIISAPEYTEPQRAFVCVSKGYLNGSEREEGTFLTIESAMSDKETRELLVKKALQELKFWKARYQHLKELSSLFAAIDEYAA